MIYLILISKIIALVICLVFVLFSFGIFIIGKEFKEMINKHNLYIKEKYGNDFFNKYINGTLSQEEIDNYINNEYKKNNNEK